MTGQLFINNKDAYTHWGVILLDGALGVLMTPAPTKPLVENKSRLNHGKQVLGASLKLDERTVSVPFGIVADSKSEFRSNFNGFVAELQSGIVALRAVELEETMYLIYEKPHTLTEMRMQMGKIVIQFNEPNPANRLPDAN